MKNKENISNNSIIKSQIDLSFHKIRELVTSWFDEPKNESIFQAKEKTPDSEEDILRKKRPKNLGLGANVKEIEHSQLSEEQILLKKRLTRKKKRKQWDNQEISKTFSDDSNDFDSRNIYVKKLSDRSKNHSYDIVINEKPKEMATSFFDTYKNEKRKKKTILTFQENFYPENLYYQIFHELTPEIVPILRGSIEYNFKEKTTIYHPQSSIYDIKALGSHIKNGFYRVGAFDSKKKFKNGFIPWVILLNQNVSISEDIIIYLDNFNNIWHVDYVLDIFNKKKTQTQKVITNAKIIFPASENGVMPIFNKPIVLNANGKPVQEKTFFQKYWMYIVPLILFLLAGNRNAEQE
ncbi:hypothetical protein PORY_000718 [Pneumocystis oryctolagi]|uniref:Uncharacterized protein n=1 Tax=Pneumocystis oryctolagi TaxID=42067 RepID=A0ACB7CFP2_9ASCO|nr:hypothetical protein PORY_000718 [Pneumocystis oryctolagi]